MVAGKRVQTAGVECKLRRSPVLVVLIHFRALGDAMFRTLVMLSPLVVLWVACDVFPLGCEVTVAQEQAAESDEPRSTTELDRSAIDAVEGLLAGVVNPGGPGLAVRVSHDGAAIMERGVGLADLAHDTAIDVESRFRIGSVTKNFTAAAILRLQDEGKLHVTDTLDKYFPDFPRGDRVTLTHLLNHTSGIASYTSKADFYKTVVSPTTTIELVESFQNDPPDFDPGARWEYNNSGYFLLGAIIEQVSGTTYDDYLSKTFFKPLKMKNTGIHSATSIIRNEAYGYSFLGGRSEKALNWDMSRAGGAGAMYSTVADLDIWLQELFSGRVISAESLAAALTPTIIETDSLDTKYGFGWFVDTHRGLRRVSHGGGLQGYSSHVAYYPDQKFSVIVLHNALPAAPGINTASLSEQIAESFLGSVMQTNPERTEDVAVSRETKAKYVGRYDYLSAVMEVTLEEDQLFAQLTGQPRFEIFPENATKFFWKVVDAQVEFVVDDQGKCIAAKHSQGLSSFRAERLPELIEVELSDEVLERHVGKYNLEILGIMDVKRDGKQLVAQIAGQPALVIYAKSENEFFYKEVPATIVFESDGLSPSSKAVIRQAGKSLVANRVE